MQIAFSVLMFVLGAAFGSFLCCQVRRLHLRDTKKQKLGNRSICLHCKKQLKWYDNVPIISWLLLRGKCRNCHRKIGIAELLSELLCALAFLAISTTINIEKAAPPEWGIFAIIIIFTITMYFLAIYDGLYGELPTLLLYLAIAISIMVVILRQISVLVSGGSSWEPTIAALIGGAILGGLYLILYLVSKGKWVGDGDWLLALSVGLALGSPWLAIIALFIANFSATIIMFPTVKKKGNHQLHFGPFLVFAFVITFTFANILESML